MKGKLAPTKSTTKAYFSFCLSLSAVVSPALYRVCEAALQAAIKGGNFGAKLTHLCGF